MKKHVFGRKFKRDVNQRKALFKGLLSELVLHGRIKTTEQKAKSIKGAAEKLVKKAQKETMLAHKLLSIDIIPEAIEKMVTTIAPQFSGRNGGYTRIIRLGNRFNDDASMVLLEWVEGVGQIVKGANKKVLRENSEQAEKMPAKAATTDVVEGEIVTEKPTKVKKTPAVKEKKEKTEKKAVKTKKK